MSFYDPAEHDAGEPLSKFDASCSYCARTVYQDVLRTVNIGGSLSHLCPTCHERQEDDYQRMTGELDHADAELQKAKDAA
jgi:hypothetical protein